ncbi:MAG: hypothetical protein ACI8PW_000732 [Methylophilaceae bacterium]|jgi:hypothetical protein
MRIRYILPIFLMQGLSVTTFLYFKFATSKASPLMHLILLGIILTIFISLFQLFFRKNGSSLKAKIAFAFVFGTLNFLLLLFYALTIYGYFHWSAAFTSDLFKAYINQLPTLLAIAGIPLFYVLALTLLCFLGFYLMYFYLSKFILLNSKDIKNSKVIKLKFFSLEIFLKPMACARLTALFCILLYALTYNIWFPRELFSIAVTNNWSLSKLAPRELFFTGIEGNKSIVQHHVMDLKIKYRPLILITIDALRSDQMGVYGGSLDNTPFLSSLLKTKQLQRFDVAHSICTLSFCGLLGILRSNYWSGLKNPSPNISDALKDNNYQSIFLLGGDHTNFSGLKSFYGNNIDLYKDGSVDSSKYPNDDFEVLKWIKDTHPKDPKSTFIFIHLMSVHEAGLRHEKFMRWQPSVVPQLSYFTTKKTYEIAYRNNYNNGILQADEMVRAIFKDLKDKGMLDNSLVIISADHGEYLGEYNRFHHGQEPYEPVSRIPLLVYDPLNPKYPDRQLSSQVDIAPTFLYAIGAKIPSNWQGIPLQIKTSRSSVLIASGDTSGVVALIDGKKYKYLSKRGDHSEWLFDLDSPELETRNIAKLNEKQGILLKMRAINNSAEK